MEGFWQRLKQRKLVQWAVAYAAAAFALLQGIDIVASKFDWPAGIERGLIVALCVGFFVALVLAWYHGEKGRQKLGGTELLIIALLLVIGGTLLWYFARPAHPGATQVAATPSTAPKASTQFAPPADTIVVLPFANVGGDPKQQYFSDGITEELTNALGQQTGLKVIAWDTASHYRNSKQPATAIARTLDVANVLTGKILREGNQVRVIVALVNAVNGYQVWADHYDDSLSNIFAVQDSISQAISGALKVKFAAAANATRKVNPQAYDLVLQARALVERAATAAPFEQARTLLEQAIALDPDYAEAHAQLAGVWFDLTQYSTLSLKDALPKVRAEANRALALDPNNVEAIIDLANADSAEGKRAEARTGYQRALELDPSNAYAHLDYAMILPMQQEVAQTLGAVQLDPDNAAAQNNLAVGYLDLGEYAQALPPSQALLRLDPHSADTAFGLAQNYALLNRNVEAVKAFDLVQPETPLAKALVAAGKLTYASVLDPARHVEAQAAVAALGRRTNLDPVSLSDVMQLELVLGDKQSVLARLPGLCASYPVACNDLSVNPMWIPLRGDPAFAALVKQYDTVSKPAAAASAGASAAAASSP